MFIENKRLAEWSKLHTPLLRVRRMQAIDLYVDGYIAQAFSPEGAMRFFSRLLGVDPRFLRPTVSHWQERPHAFFIASPDVQGTPPSFATNGQLLDYVISQVGTVVPQLMFSFSGNPTEAQRWGNGYLNMPIFFVHNDRVTLGRTLAISGAVGGSQAMLLGAGDAAPVGDNSTLYIRINWPGYDGWSSQIRTKDRTAAHNMITLEQFASRVANAVDRFFDYVTQSQGQDPNWRVGIGGITKAQVILIGVVHVSPGSWQPILQLNRYVVPRRQHIPGLPYSYFM